MACHMPCHLFIYLLIEEQPLQVHSGYTCYTEASKSIRWKVQKKITRNQDIQTGQRYCDTTYNEKLSDKAVPQNKHFNI